MSVEEHVEKAIQKSIDDSGEFVPSEAIVSTRTTELIDVVLDQTINFVISLVGIVTNILVIIVFAKQGFKDSVGITMTTIAVWDFIKCLGGLMQRMAGPISLFAPADAHSWANISVVIFNYLISFSSYVTSVLAAYVAVERCLCVTMPLKVKWLLTPKLVFIICMVISVSVFGYFAVIFGIYDVVWVYSAHYNATVAQYQYNSFSTNNTNLFLYYNMSGALWPLVSLVVIVISTVIIAYKLQKASEFRYKKNDTGALNNPAEQDKESEVDDKGNKTKSGPKSSKNNMSKRDQQVVKMLLVIIAIYIVNLIPRVVHYMAKYFIPEFYYLRKYHNLITVCAFVVFTFDFINGAVNLFVFLAMSSSFRTTYLEIFPYCARSKAVE